jgi:hypothetical protein
MMENVDPDLPVDPNLEELPAELREHEGPLTLTASDEDGNVWEGSVTREQIASAQADARRLREQDFGQDLG